MIIDETMREYISLYIMCLKIPIDFFFSDVTSSIYKWDTFILEIKYSVISLIIIYKSNVHPTITLFSFSIYWVSK